ncbi:large ribosomal subunit protein uL13m [Dromaius novaehollandiae]|uniref:large ribosomal subunit protein uL13m n=1 Tax=Dromaius novaehollandiae TaxID=8790 RepID=UPI00311FCE7A
MGDLRPGLVPPGREDAAAREDRGCDRGEARRQAQAHLSRAHCKTPQNLGATLNSAEGAGDCGDHVVIINTRHIAFSGNKWEQKVYSSHTGYPGGFKQVTATQLHMKDPTAIVKLTIYRMLPKNLQRRTLMQRLHLFPDDVIPEDIQKNLVEELPQPRAVPKRLDEYTPEEIAAFPMVWTPCTRLLPRGRLPGAPAQHCPTHLGSSGFAAAAVSRQNCM